MPTITTTKHLVLSGGHQSFAELQVNVHLAAADILGLDAVGTNLELLAREAGKVYIPTLAKWSFIPGNVLFDTGDPLNWVICNGRASNNTKLVAFSASDVLGSDGPRICLTPIEAVNAAAGASLDYQMYHADDDPTGNADAFGGSLDLNVISSAALTVGNGTMDFTVFVQVMDV